MSSPASLTIKKISVQEQHELFLKEIKDLKAENEALKNIFSKLVFQTTGVSKPFLDISNKSESWEHINP
jgi:hypothetical protein